MATIEKTGITAKVADLILNHPKKLLLAGVLFLAALVPGLGALKADFSYRIWFRPEDPLLTRFDAFERRFGNDDQALVALHNSSGIFNPGSAKLIQQITEDLWQIPEVIRVDSLANYNWVHADGDDIKVDPFLPDDRELTEGFLAERKAIALKDETLPSYLVSKDGKTALFHASIKPALEGSPNYLLIATKLRELSAKYDKDGKHKIYVSGNASLSDAFREATEHDLSRLVPITLLVIVIFLWFSFRSLGAVAASLLVVFASILATLGTYGWIGMRFNNVTSIVPQVLIAISVADSVHMLVTYLRAMSGGMSRLKAAEYSILKNFFPTLLNSITISIGFFTFAQAKIVPISEMGIGVGIGTIYAWILTYLFVAPLMVVLPMRSKIAAETETEAHGKVAPWIDALTHWIQRHAGKVLLAGLALTAVSGVYALKNQANSDPFKYFAKDFHLSIANDFIEENVGGGLGVEAVIDSGSPDGIKDPAFLRKVEAYQEWVLKQPKVTKVVSPVDILKAMNRSLHGDDQAQYRLPDDRNTVAQLLFLYSMSLPQGMDLNNRITVESDALRMTTFWTLHGSTESVRRFHEMEAKGKEFGLKVEVTGKGPLYQKMNGYVVPTFVNSVVWSTILIGVIMIIALRSIKLGLISMIPNLLPNLVGGAVVYWMGLYLDVGTVVVASICLGIAVDDTIHFLVNYVRAIRSGSTAREAVAWVYHNSGLPMLVTTLVLVCSFGTFIFADFTPNANFGKLVAIVLSFALLCEFMLTSSLLIYMEKWLASPKTVKKVKRASAAPAIEA